MLGGGNHPCRCRPLLAGWTFDGLDVDDEPSGTMVGLERRTLLSATLAGVREEYLMRAVLQKNGGLYFHPIGRTRGIPTKG